MLARATWPKKTTRQERCVAAAWQARAAVLLGARPAVAEAVGCGGMEMGGVGMEWLLARARRERPQECVSMSRRCMEGHAVPMLVDDPLLDVLGEDVGGISLTLDFVHCQHLVLDSILYP